MRTHSPRRVEVRPRAAVHGDTARIAFSRGWRKRTSSVLGCLRLPGICTSACSSPAAALLVIARASARSRWARVAVRSSCRPGTRRAARPARAPSTSPSRSWTSMFRYRFEPRAVGARRTEVLAVRPAMLDRFECGVAEGARHHAVEGADGRFRFVAQQIRGRLLVVDGFVRHPQALVEQVVLVIVQQRIG